MLTQLKNHEHINCIYIYNFEHPCSFIAILIKKTGWLQIISCATGSIKSLHEPRIFFFNFPQKKKKKKNGMSIQN